MLNDPPFGDQTVTFVTVTETGQPGFLGVKQKSTVDVDVEGCHFRSYKSVETSGETTGSVSDGQTRVATEVWKCTAPPDPAVVAAKSTGQLKYAGMTFEIEGPVQPKYDQGHQLHHFIVYAKRQVS